MGLKVVGVITAGICVAIYIVAPSKVTVKYKDFEFTAER